jgi:hypothetical protein
LQRLCSSSKEGHSFNFHGSFQRIFVATEFSAHCSCHEIFFGVTGTNSVKVAVEPATEETGDIDFFDLLAAEGLPLSGNLAKLI